MAGLVLAGALLSPVGVAGSAVAICANPDCASGTPPVVHGGATVVLASDPDDGGQIVAALPVPGGIALVQYPSDPPVIRG